MANTQGYFGFAPVGTSNGPMNFRLSTRRVASTAGAIYKGDPVEPVTSSATGYIKQSAPGDLGATVPLAGIFWGCEYLSVSQKRSVWSPYWPGSDASGDVLAYVIDDPNSRFKVQANGSSMVITGTTSTWTSGPVGQLANFAIGTGSTSTGLSGAYLSAVGTTAAYPFIVVDMVQDPPGTNGADPTTNYNYLIVAFNNEWLRGNAAVTGIS